MAFPCSEMDILCGVFFCCGETVLNGSLKGIDLSVLGYYHLFDGKGSDWLTWMLCESFSLTFLQC